MFSYESLQWTVAICHYISALSLIIYAAASDTYLTSQINIYYTEWFPLCPGENSCDNGCYTQTKSIKSIEMQLTVALAFASVVSGTNHLVQAIGLALKQQYIRKIIISGNMWLRTLDYSISATLMTTVLNSMFVSPTDVMVNMFSAAMMFTVIWAGWASETLAISGRFNEARIVFWMSSIGFMIGFGANYTVFFIGQANISDGAVAPSSIVISFIVAIFLGYLSFPITFCWHIGLRTEPKHTPIRHLKCETLFSFESLFTKLVLLGIFFSATLSKSKLADYKIGDPCPSLDITVTSYLIIGTFILVCTIITVVFVVNMWPLIMHNSYTCRDIPLITAKQKSIAKKFTRLPSKQHNASFTRNLLDE